jgi:hypothetical protein
MEYHGATRACDAPKPRALHQSETQATICVVQDTKLGLYLRRCKSLVLDDGYLAHRLCSFSA